MKIIQDIRTRRASARFPVGCQRGFHLRNLATTVLVRIRERITTRRWLWGFELEEARQAHGIVGNYWRSAACCIALVLINVWQARRRR